MVEMQGTIDLDLDLDLIQSKYKIIVDALNDLNSKVNK